MISGEVPRLHTYLCFSKIITIIRIPHLAIQAGEQYTKERGYYSARKVFSLQLFPIPMYACIPPLMQALFSPAVITKTSWLISVYQGAREVS